MMSDMQFPDRLSSKSPGSGAAVAGCAGLLARSESRRWRL